MLRKAFTLGGPVRRATLYATARGVYELRLNGARVGDAVLAPEWTSYGKRIQYQAYDVTPMLRPGANALAALVGQGWYAGRIGRPGLFGMRRIYGAQPALLLRLEIVLAGGETVVLASDGTWRRGLRCPIVSADLLDGETYDARLDQPGWDSAGFDDSGWPAVALDPQPGPAQLVWQRNEPVRVTAEVRPVRLTQPQPGTYLFDLGQNIAGWCRLRLRGSAGSPCTMKPPFDAKRWCGPSVSRG